MEPRTDPATNVGVIIGAIVKEHTFEEIRRRTGMLPALE